MKKILLPLLLACAFCCTGTSLRIDLVGIPPETVIKSSLPGTVQNGKSINDRYQRTLIFPERGIWQRFELKFTSPRDAQIAITLRGTGKEAILVDSFSSEGFILADGGFEEINLKRKRFTKWGGNAANLFTDAKGVRSGRSCGRITYASRLAQRKIKLAANKPLILRGFYRSEKMPPTRGQMLKTRGVPADANAVFDPTFTPKIPLIISTGRLELRPTFENCSVYLNLLPEEKKKKIKVDFFFRKAGEKSFTAALPPAEVIQEQAWRGSLFNLKENTSYEFKAVITGKNYKKTVPGKFRTLNSRVPFETILLPPGKCTVKITSGTPSRYKRYTSNGRIITAVKGSEAVFNLKALSYVIFDNIVIDAKGAQHGFKLDQCRNIFIRNCEVYNFGRESAGPRYGSHMYYSGGHHTSSGKLLYDDLAFRLFQTRNVLIERCFVHDPAYPSQTWLYAHPSGAGCIKVTDCANTVVRWNDFVGRDDCRFIDHIIGPPNGSLRGGFARDADIYGNLFAFSNDDGAELEGGAMNIRCYGNRIEGTLSGLSTGPIGLGPTYLIGNLFNNPGDDDGSFSLAFKNGGGAKGISHTRGRLYMLHNTVGDNWVSRYGVGNFSIPHKDYYPSCKAYIKNNTIRAKGRFYHRLWHTFNTDCNGNLLERLPGVDQELIDKDMEAIKKSGHEKQGIFAKVHYVDAPKGNYALKPGTPGYNRIIRQNNMPSFRHCGAYEGKKGEWFPKRPLVMFADKTELHWTKNDRRVQQITLEVPAGKKFKVIASDKFFTVKERSASKAFKRPGHKGLFRKYTYSVNLNREKMKAPRRYSGAILFRTDKGLSLPVTLYADGRIPLKKAIECPKRFIRMKQLSGKAPRYSYTAAPGEEGIYFMMVRGKLAPNLGSGKILLTFKGQKAKQELTRTGIDLYYSGSAGASTWLLLKSFKLRRLVPLKIGKGEKVQADFESLNGVTVEEVVLTKEPWILLRNREYAVKSGK